MPYSTNACIYLTYYTHSHGFYPSCGEASAVLFDRHIDSIGQLNFVPAEVFASNARNIRAQHITPVARLERRDIRFGFQPASHRHTFARRQLNAFNRPRRMQSHLLLAQP